MNSDIIFALDIGTRSVVGVVAKKIDNSLKVIHIKSVFHEQRAMVDGQIEDIKKVSSVIQEVKEDLEKTSGLQLNEVYIAAAGRSLKTEKVKYEKKIDIKKPISDELKTQIEMEALQNAHDVFYKTTKNERGFYCVGYSVLGYELDDSNIANIVGHRAEKISIEIIAAFLPHLVVEGLYSCMDYNKLNVVSLTLEPIAAMNLVIPSDLRLLNLALVDIGAGTSDIAVSKDGSIIGYDMATVAGDEITESLMKNYLVDFNTAEKIKIALEDNEIITFTDILGMSNSINKKDIIASIEHATIELCKEISTKILGLNNEPPIAVFLIGGGSKTPNLKRYLSEFLNLPEFRIAIGTQQTIKNVDISLIADFGPELITPIGIAYSSIISTNYDFFSVIVNGSKVRLYNIRQMKVMDALLMAGFDSRKLMGFSGKNLSFTLNNKDYYYKGEYSTPAQIFVNSNFANIETKINPGDIIEVIPAVDGVTPIVKISDIVQNNTYGKILFNNLEVTLGTKYLVNNLEVDYNYIIGNSDVIEIINITKLSDLIDLYEINPEYYSFYQNGESVNLDLNLTDNMIIDAIQKDNLNSIKSYTKNEALSNMQFEENKEESNIIRVTLNGEILELKARDDNSPYIFADMIAFTDIDPSNPQGNIILLHNGDEASYTRLINDNDIIVIKWQNKI